MYKFQCFFLTIELVGGCSVTYSYCLTKYTEIIKKMKIKFNEEYINGFSSLPQVFVIDIVVHKTTM